MKKLDTTRLKQVLTTKQRLTRSEYLMWSQELQDVQRSAFNSFVDSLTFIQYHRITKELKYNNCSELAVKVSSSKNLKLKAEHADRTYKILKAFRDLYPKDTGIKPRLRLIVSN